MSWVLRWGGCCKEGKSIEFSIVVNYEIKEVLWPNYFGLKIEHSRTTHIGDHKVLDNRSQSSAKI